MSQPLAPGSQSLTAPRFYITPSQRLSLHSLFPALVVALAGLFAVLYALNHARHGRSFLGTGSVPFGRAGLGGDSAPDDTDDPSRVDTIYLGGPDQAPTATRPARSPSTVHPFVVVRLPRSGDGTGQIPDSPAGHLLYNWLAAFNNKDLSVVAHALPTPTLPAASAAQVELRRQTGGFTLVSAHEIQPDLIVFRLHDQTPAETEVLGTLRLRPETTPPTIASFSLRALP